MSKTNSTDFQALRKLASAVERPNKYVIFTDTVNNEIKSITVHLSNFLMIQQHGNNTTAR